MTGTPPGLLEWEPPLLSVLQKVPHLANMCASVHVLQELWSISTEARSHVNGLVTGLQIDCATPVTDLHTSSLLAVLSGSRLQRMCVVLHLENHARMEADLSAISACLSQSLSSVTQLSMQLRGVEDFVLVFNPLMVAAAMAVRILGPLCGPLTHITVSGDVDAPGENTYTLLLDAASAVCAATLTHFNFSMRGRSHTVQLPQGEELTMECGFDFLIDITACKALRSFTCLTHLRLQHASLCDEEAWAAFPRSLQFLDMESAYRNLPEHLSPLPHPSLLPNLRSLSMQYCDCYHLIQILKACPELQQLNLVELQAPACPEEQQDLKDILVHPVWCREHDGGPTRTPITKYHQSYAPDNPPHLDPWVEMAAIPVLPTVTSFRFDFTNKKPCPLLPAHPDRLMPHIPLAFQNVGVLHLENVFMLDSDLMQLSECASLRKLRLNYSHHVTRQALLQLAAIPPNLMSIEVYWCKLINPENSRVAIQILPHHRPACDDAWRR